ncbi:MAG: ABC transporter ATP-binding protein [Thermodesulfobacteriota bacterium]|nr:ABC transporter ATP-binding protein [Thermodesulfobacteriota bacterium]
MLEIENITAGYGPLLVLRDISIQVNNKEIVAVVGANCAGKSTLLKVITGLIRPSQGNMRLNGSNLALLEPHEIVDQGIVMVPEGRQLFPEMTVEENLLVGSHISRARLQRDINFERVYSFFPFLKERRKQISGTLSGGQQQMLAIARALMGEPKLLLLDEISQGLSPLLVRDLYKQLLELNQQGITILLVEQSAKLGIDSSHRAYVLTQGKITLSGNRDELMSNPNIKTAYFGVAE